MSGLTVHAAAVAASDPPLACWARIRWLSSAVSLRGPFGPRLPGSRPANPSAANARCQRHNVASLTPNAGATAVLRAALIATSRTAASRRAASSPASQHSAAEPKMNTTPPSVPANSPAAAPTGTASPGSIASGGWALLPVMISSSRTQPDLATDIADLAREAA